MALFNNNGSQQNGQPGFQQLDGSALQRPITMPKKNYIIVIVVMVAALAIGSVMFNAFVENVIHGAENQQKAVTKILQREGVSMNLPKCSELITKTNGEIKRYLKKKGNKFYDNSSDEDKAAKGFDWYRIPDDVSKGEASDDISNGLGSANAKVVAKYLPASWRLLMNRSEGKEMKLKYTDLDATDPETAIAHAIKNQGFNKKKAGDISQDSAGNFTKNGTIKINGKTYYWTISTCDCSAVYSAGGLPQTAQYVGITLRKG